MASKELGATLLPCNVFDHELCIICQKSSKDILQSNENGIQRIREAAQIRKDEVADRINTLKISDNFFYHMTNTCYKAYTNSHYLKQLKDKDIVCENVLTNGAETSITSPSPSQRSTRSHSTPRAPPSSKIDPTYNMKCVICGNTSHKKVYQKTRISEPTRAQSLLNASKFIQDECYTRIADLQTTSTLIAADIYVHKICIRKYLKKYEHRLSENEQYGKLPKVNLKKVLFDRAVPSIDQLIREGKCCEISELVEFLLELKEEGEDLTSTLRNRDVKEFLEAHFGDQIILVPNNRVNESYFLFSSTISPDDLVQKIKNQDIMAEAGKMVRKELLKVDFGLNDSFCDETDLKTSWENTMMPESLLAFFAALFNIPKSKLFKQNIRNANEIFRESETNTVDTFTDSWTQDHKNVQLHCFFQIFAYSIHNGKMMTPFHSMVGNYIYSSNRSRNELTAFNRAGLSPSYNSVRKSRDLLESYTILRSKNNVPIPSHFTRNGFTMGAFDNADYCDKSSLTGTASKHYASMVLFQDASEKPSTKPRVSLSSIHVLSPVIALPCQSVEPYRKPLTRPELPPDMLLSPENCNLTLLDTKTARERASKIEFCVQLIRTGLPGISSSLTWTPSRVLVSQTSIPLMRVGFLPVIPKPITDPATVRKALENFENVRVQIDQPVLPVWCDDGVFAPAMDIVLHEPDNFKNILLMLGPFHWTKVLLRCAGRLFVGSGIDDSLKECEVFGPMVLDSVINGCHYIRSMKGMLMIEDVIYKLMWEEFWLKYETSSFKSIEFAMKVKEKFQQKKRCPLEFENLLNNIDDIREAFSSFKAECESRSEVCQFLGIWLKIVAIIKNAVAADREGNWDLLVAVVEDSLPVFAHFDCINYLRHGSWYLEKIKVLELSHPEIYRRFSNGQFAVQDRNGWFCGIGCDMKLEQTIQKVSKGPGGHFVAGQTKKEKSVAQYELLFHEILGITNLFHSITNNKQSDDRSEYNLGSGFSPSQNTLFNTNVEKLVDFIKKRKNPYNMNSHSNLHNIVTQQAIPHNISESILRLMENGKRVYTSFRTERFVDKSVKLNAKIKKQKSPLLNQELQPKELPLKNMGEITPRDIALAQKHIEIAKQRGFTIEKILAYDILAQSPLFDGNYPTSPNKALLVSELERIVSNADLSKWQKNSELNTAVVADFMSKVRRLKMENFKTLGELCEDVVSSSLKICPQQNVLHIVFDSYIDHSLKECERIRRSTVPPIDIVDMNSDTLVPRQIEKFWVSSSNKQNLQSLVKTVIPKYHDSNSDILLSSYIIDDELHPAKMHRNNQETVVEALSKSWLEEADERLILHVAWSVEIRNCERVVVLSNDADTFALLLYYFPYLKTKGLKELWHEYGTGDKRRMIPIHDIVCHLGESFAKVILKAHVLTGDDLMSKIGTKKAAITTGNPLKYLSSFASNEELTDNEIIEAEEYLVRVWSGNRKTFSITFDMLRVEYYSCYSQCIDGLPPTSSAVKSHIHRGAFCLRHKSSLLDTDFIRPSDVSLSAENNGWHLEFGIYLPEKHLRLLPDDITAICNCGSDCTTKRCKCMKLGVRCVMFCHGKKRTPCSNTKMFNEE